MVSKTKQKYIFNLKAFAIIFFVKKDGQGQEGQGQEGQG